MAKRAEGAAATRRRILDATMAVHDQQGIVGTSVRDVAGRAGVSPATVLRHFPAMGDLTEACGRLSDELYPMPTESVLDGASAPVDGLRRVAAAFFGWWAEYGPGWSHLEVDRRELPQVDGWLRNVEAGRRGLIATALGRRIDGAEVALVTALTSHGAWQSLRDAGMSPEEAATEVARFVMRGDAP